MDVVGRPECVWPEVRGDCTWPTLLCMKEHGSSVVLEISNALFGHSILEMGVNATEGKLLVGFFDGASEGVILEATVVSVVSLDVDSMGARVGLEGMLGLHRVGGAEGLLKMEV